YRPPGCTNDLHRVAVLIPPARVSVNGGEAASFDSPPVRNPPPVSGGCWNEKLSQANSPGQPMDIRRVNRYYPRPVRPPGSGATHGGRSLGGNPGPKECHGDLRRSSRHSRPAWLSSCRRFAGAFGEDRNAALSDSLAGQLLSPFPIDAAAQSGRARVHGHVVQSERGVRSARRTRAALRVHEPHGSHRARGFLLGPL